MDAPGVSGQVYNIAAGTKTTLNELVAQLQELIGTDIEPSPRARATG